MSELRVAQRGGAVTFEVRVSPRASRNAIIGVHEGTLKVALTAPPVGGAANDALIKLLAKALGVAKSKITIIRGDHTRNKLLQIQDLPPSALKF